jgi:hypothetical protein
MSRWRMGEEWRMGNRSKKKTEVKQDDEKEVRETGGLEDWRDEGM